MNNFKHLLFMLVSLVYVSSPATAVTSESLRSMRLFNSPRIISHNYHGFCLDRQGFLWIGSDLGLVKFDGSDHEVFRHDSDTHGSISSNIVLKILHDSSGRIWVSTADGLNLYDHRSNSFRTVRLPGIPFNGYILDLTEQNDGTISFIVAGVGVFLVDGSEDGDPEAVRINCFPAHIDFNTLVSTSDGGFICGTHSGNIVRMHPNGVMKTVGVTHDFFTGIRKIGDNTAIAYTPSGIWKISIADMNVDPVDMTPLHGVSVNDICIGQDNTAYIATGGGGIWRMEAGSTTLNRMQDLFHPSLDIDRLKFGAIYMAPDGNLWLGCNHHGVLMLPSTPIPFTYHPFGRTINDFDGGISAMTVSGGDIWAALEDNDIVQLSGNHEECRRRIHIPRGRGICRLYRADDGILYAAAMNDGIYRIDPSSGKMSRIIGLDNRSIRYSISGGGNMRDLYIGIHGHGIMKHDLSTGRSTMYSSRNQGKNRILNDWVVSTCTDSRQRLWVGLYSGLACYDIAADTFRIINQEPFFSKGACNSIRETRTGRLLIGSSSGLIVYNTDADSVERVITIADGLCDNDIRSLEIDNDDVAWIGTLHGLSQYVPSTGKVASLQGGQGITETSFLHSDFDKENGLMYFAGNMGYTTFMPSELHPVPFKGRVSVSGIYINGKKLTESQTSGRHQAIETDTAMTCKRINISYKDNNIVLRLSTMDFRDPANVSYEWCMDNGGDSWIPTRPGTSDIVIPGLDAGDHTLLLRAADNSVHSDITRLTIHVTPPWYLSDAAKTIYALIVLGILALVFVIFRKKKREEIYEAKVKFFMDISHEIRSPVTCILSPLETLLRKDYDAETTAMLQAMHRNAGRILSLANQLLEIRKIDKGRKRLVMQPTDLAGFASELIEIYRPMARSKSIEMSLEASGGVSEVWIDRDNFDKVLVNLITNAIKYTPEGGKVNVNLDTTRDPELGDCARIRVTDTGIGIDPKHINRIFERFYQGQRSPGGFGVGLNLARQLVTLHHGSLTAANRQDGVKGSVFTVLLPLGKTHLTPDEIADNTPDKLALIPDTSRKEDTGAGATYNQTTVTRRHADRYTILIADDDRELREYLAFHFSRTDKVLEASDGSEALQLLRDNKVDIVISDVMMPGTDGIALLKAIKTNTETTHTPVILLSSRSDIADRMQGWTYGADGYIGKPFAIDELETMIVGLINNRLRIKGKFTGAQDNCSTEPDPSIMGNDESLLERITRVIESRVTDPAFNVEALGAEVGISRAHLHRKMKSLIGMTTSDYIRNVRLRRACEILKRHDVDIAQVAYNVGFTSQPHFSTAFRKFTGLTPTEYRQRNSQNNDQPEG